MSRVMFVDDEPLILKTMERLFRAEHDWKTSICGGGAEALARLEQEPVDIIVSDLNMPGMDGITLLERVRERFPGVARFILSGYSTQADMVRTASVVHQFLVKPCNTNLLRQRIRRVLSLRASMDARVHSAWTGSLPSMPKTFGAITVALESPTASARSIAALVERDMALSSKVLQLVNCAYFGLCHRVTSVEQAVVLMGTNALRALVLSQEVFQTFSSPEQSERGLLLQEHSVRAATLARRFSDDRAVGEMAFTATLLHDIGGLIFMSLADHEECDIDPTSTHAAVGASLLALWGIPDEIVNPVEHHHEPRNALPPDRTVTALVHVAEALERSAGNEVADPPIDLEFLEEMGMAPRLDEWRRMASRDAAERAVGSS